MRFKLLLGVQLFLSLYASVVLAAPLDTNILDSILGKYQIAASAWGGVMVDYASWLFWGLALISMVWTFGMMSLKRADIQELFAEMVRFFAVTGFFWWILYNGPAIANSIIRSMWMIGAKAIGQTTDFKLGGIVQIGFDIFFNVLDQSSVWSPVDSACGIIIAAIILAILALVGVNLLLLFVSAWILVYGGVFFLGFGGSRWTSDIAINFYKTVLALGAQIMAMLLLISIGKSFVDQYYASTSGASNLKELGVMLVVALTLLYLTNKIPPLIAGIVGVSGVGSIGGFGASAAIGAASMAAAAASAGGSMALSGATSLAGGATALKAAFQQAQQHMAEGSGMFARASSETVPGGSSGSGVSNPISGGSDGFMSSMGTAAATAGKFAADMGANFAKGAGSVAQAKASSTKSSVMADVDATTGGKIAAAINAADTQEPAFSGDSLGTASEEVAAFVDKRNLSTGTKHDNDPTAG